MFKLNTFVKNLESCSYANLLDVATPALKNIIIGMAPLTVAVGDFGVAFCITIFMSSAIGADNYMTAKELRFIKDVFLRVNENNAPLDVSYFEFLESELVKSGKIKLSEVIKYLAGNPSIPGVQAESLKSLIDQFDEDGREFTDKICDSASEDLKTSILVFISCILAVDGDISFKETKYIKKLLA